MALVHEASRFRDLRKRITAGLTAVTLSIGSAAILEGCSPFASPHHGVSISSNIEHKKTTPGQRQYQEFQRIATLDINYQLNQDLLQEINALSTNPQVQQDFAYDHMKIMYKTQPDFLDSRPVTSDAYTLWRSGSRSKNAQPFMTISVNRDAFGNLDSAYVSTTVDAYGNFVDFNAARNQNFTAYQLESLARGVLKKPVVWQMHTYHGVSYLLANAREGNEDVTYAFYPNGNLVIQRVPAND